MGLTVSGRQDIYVQPFPGPGSRRQISDAGGVLPRCRGDSQEIFYRRGGEIFAVGWDPDSGRATSKPEVVLEELGGDYNWPFDVSADGQNLYFIEPDLSLAAGEIHVVIDWLEGLDS